MRNSVTVGVFVINIGANTKKIALMGVMLAFILALSYLEHLLPPLPVLPPNFRFGLSNIVTMYCFFFIGKSSALTLNILKSLFVALMRGPFAGVLSFSGGMLSIIVLIILTAVFRDKISYIMLSVCAAIAHNLGQIAAASFVVKTNILWVYFPVLLATGIVMGIITGTLLKIIMPLLHKLLML